MPADGKFLLRRLYFGGQCFGYHPEMRDERRIKGLGKGIGTRTVCTSRSAAEGEEESSERGGGARRGEEVMVSGNGRGTKHYVKSS